MALKRIGEYKPEKADKILDENFDSIVNEMADKAKLTAPPKKQEEVKPQKEPGPTTRLKNVRLPLYIEKAFLKHQHEHYLKTGNKETFTDMVIGLLSKELRQYIE
jgi:hypothetical protein